MIFSQCVSSNAIPDQIYARKLNHTYCMYMVSLQHVIRYDFKTTITQKKILFVRFI